MVPSQQVLKNFQCFFYNFICFIESIFLLYPVIDASGRGPVVGQTPPPLVLNRRSPSEQQCLSVKKKRAYSLIPQ